MSLGYADIHISKKDKSLSFLIAVVVHIAVFIIAGVSLIKPPQFGIDQGLGSIEVDLVAASEQVVVQGPVEQVVQEKSEVIQEQVVAPVVKQEAAIKTEGKDKVTAQSSGGVITEAKPDYLKNPVPVYPESAHRRGYEGTVFLKTLVDKNGFPIKVEIEQSSGHKVLDEAALDAVKAWQFRPARIGDLAIESTVRVPVKFDLKNSGN